MNNDPTFIGLFLGAELVLLIALIIQIFLMRSIESSKQKLHRLLLEIPTRYVKTLHEISEKFVVGIQYGHQQDDVSSQMYSIDEDQRNMTNNDEEDSSFSRCN